MNRHNHQPPADGDEPAPRRRVGPERERLLPGEIDLTGVVQQPDDLRDVIADALIEARAAGGEIPDWGARAIARALANRIGELDSPALHTFAAVGRVRDAIGAELAAIYASPDSPPEIREWINYLGTYLINRAVRTDRAATERTSPEEPFPGGALDQVSRYLRHAFAEADERGQAITEDDARAIATLLAPLLGTTSAMSRFADSARIDVDVLLAECRELRRRAYRTSDIAELWIPRLVHYLQHLPSDPAPVSAEAVDAESRTGSAAEGIREFGDPFRAFLMLNDVDPSRDDLIPTFHEWYIATFASRDKLLEELTEVTDWEASVAAFAAEYGIEDFVRLDRNALWEVIQDAWDIVELDGKYHVFEK